MECMEWDAIPTLNQHAMRGRGFDQHAMRGKGFDQHAIDAKKKSNLRFRQHQDGPEPVRPCEIQCLGVKTTLDVRNQPLILYMIGVSCGARDRFGDVWSMTSSSQK